MLCMPQGAVRILLLDVLLHLNNWFVVSLVWCDRIRFEDWNGVIESGLRIESGNLVIA